MRTPALVVGAVLAVAACASPATSASPGETVDGVCADVADLAADIVDSGNLLASRWTLRVDDLGVRAASIGTFEGDRLMEGLAALSVGIEADDIDMAVEGLDKITDVCL